MSLLPTYLTASFDATNLTGSYQDLGSALGSAAYGFEIYNTSNVDVFVSFDDGTTTNATIPAGESYKQGSFNHSFRSENGTWVLPKGAQPQVKQVTGAGASGDIIINIARK